MKRSNRLILLIGIFLAVVAFVGIVLMLQSPTTGSDTGGPPTTKDVLYAKQDIPLGTQVEAAMFEQRNIPIGNAAQDAIGDSGLVVGQTARQDIKTGAMIRQVMFTGTGGRVVEVASQIPQGLRGMSIQVDQQSGVGTLINAGDRVDVVVGLQNFPVISIDKDTKQPVPVAGISATSVKVLVQNVLVVGALLPPQPAAEGQAQGQGQGQPTGGQGTTLNGQQEIVIVAVTPQQAEIIKYAQLDASISLVLRSPKDFKDANGAPIEPPVDPTSGIVLKTLVDQYGVLPPELIETVLPRSATQ